MPIFTVLDLFCNIKTGTNLVIIFKLRKNILKSFDSPYGKRIPMVGALKTRHQNIFLWGMIILFGFNANF